MKTTEILSSLNIGTYKEAKEWCSKLSDIYAFFKGLKLPYSVNVASIGNVELVRNMPVYDAKNRGNEWKIKKVNAQKNIYGNFENFSKITVQTQSGNYAVIVPQNTEIETAFLQLLGIVDVSQLKTAPPAETIHIQGNILPYIKKAQRFVGKDGIRPTMKNVCIDFSEGWCEVVATDAHKLYQSPKFKCNVVGERQILIDGKFSSKIKQKDIKEEDTTIEIFEGNKIAFNGLKTDISDCGKYPNYKMVIPSYEKALYVEKNQLIEKINLVKGMANKVTEMVYFHINGAIQLSSQDIDFSLEAEATMPYIHKDIPDTDISLNGRFMVECLKALDGDNLAILTDGMKSQPVLIKNEYETVLLMPLLN